MRANPRFAIVCLTLAWLTGLPGCAALRGLVNPPGRLLEQARSAVEQKDLESAYRDLASIRKRYPDSAESREAFPLAAAIFQNGYFRDRYQQPDSHWVTTEPGFLLDWFASLLSGPEFPQAEAEALFVGMPYGYFRELLALAQARPELSRWGIRAQDDNGIIESIAAASPSP
jgi:hypothetical protein